jgi:hypothetical protein
VCLATEVPLETSLSAAWQLLTPGPVDATDQRKALVNRLQLGMYEPVLGDDQEVDLALRTSGEKVRVDTRAAMTPNKVGVKPSEEGSLAVMDDRLAEEDLDLRCFIHLVPALPSGAAIILAQLPDIITTRDSQSAEPAAETSDVTPGVVAARFVTDTATTLRPLRSVVVAG